ncbi:MAG: hypothetical protein LBN10_05170 [Propionibacteriaceae bacterium]|jgi:hypothetical protein|nr:hypothetical protein [Propionibacteriaceae bacterium]
MTWFKSDDRIPYNSKFRKCSLAAVGLWLYSGCRTAAQLEDGFVPYWFPDTVGADHSLVQELLDAGLWEPADGGWQMHDYADWNATKAQRMEAQEKMRQRKAESRRRNYPEDVRPQRKSTPEKTTTTSTTVRPKRTRAKPT